MWESSDQKFLNMAIWIGDRVEKVRRVNEQSPFILASFTSSFQPSKFDINEWTITFILIITMETNVSL
jgi:hypothetical protein